MAASSSLLYLVPPLRFDQQYPAHAEITLFRGDDLPLRYRIDDGSPSGTKDLTNWQMIWWVLGRDFDHPFQNPVLLANVPDSPLAGVTIAVPEPATEGLVDVDVEPELLSSLAPGWYSLALRIRDANSRDRVAARGLILLV